MSPKTNITTIGGGTGTFNVLTGLKKYPNLNLAAIVSMSDSGGSTGVLRDEFGILPPGDIRRAVLALSRQNLVIRKLFEYRFDKDSSVNGHTIGNLLLTAMSDITGSFEAGLEEVCKMFGVEGKVIPVTFTTTDLGIELESGEQIIGETHIDEPEHDGNLRITKAFLTPEAHANSKAIEAIENSDIIIIGPGDLYTSIIPNLLVKGISEAIRASSAKVVYFCNIMTKFGETTNFEVIDFVDVIETYLGAGRLDYVVVNNGNISDELVEKYHTEEQKKPVKVKDRSVFHNKHYKIVERDILNERDYIRHHPDKLAKIIDDIVQGWVK